MPVPKISRQNSCVSLESICQNHANKKKIAYEQSPNYKRRVYPSHPRKKNVIKYGFNHVTNLIESGRAKLVIIAHDVDPIELVLWMPALCVKRNIPFVIFKSKARLGTLVHKKTTACIAICEVDPSDATDFKQISRKAKH
eukprot:UN01962